MKRDASHPDAAWISGAAHADFRSSIRPTANVAEADERR